MTYAIQDIIEALKSAREAAGLSQRALSDRTGVPQSHISKIESGGADIRLSSLIEIARALELEVKLVPRKSVAAVDNVVRAVRENKVVPTGLAEINRALDTVKDLRPVYPGLETLTKLQSSLQTIKNLNSSVSAADEWRGMLKAVRVLDDIAAAKSFASEVAELPSKKLTALEDAAKLAERIRNQLVHNVPRTRSLPRPVYRLDEE
ncbi:MAG: helix-turn-helix domain-containing protein [Hyphomicrobiaceae bacterium]